METSKCARAPGIIALADAVSFTSVGGTETCGGRIVAKSIPKQWYYSSLLVGNEFIITVAWNILITLNVDDTGRS